MIFAMEEPELSLPPQVQKLVVDKVRSIDNLKRKILRERISEPAFAKRCLRDA